MRRQSRIIRRRDGEAALCMTELRDALCRVKRREGEEAPCRANVRDGECRAELLFRATRLDHVYGTVRFDHGRWLVFLH